MDAFRGELSIAPQRTSLRPLLHEASMEKISPPPPFKNIQMEPQSIAYLFTNDELRETLKASKSFTKHSADSVILGMRDFGLEVTLFCNNLRKVELLGWNHTLKADNEGYDLRNFSKFSKYFGRFFAIYP